jgi:hypothetical protein
MSILFSEMLSLHELSPCDDDEHHSLAAEAPIAVDQYARDASLTRPISENSMRTSVLAIERGVGENVNIIFIQMHAEF